jgi:hypothetical protein
MGSMTVPRKAARMVDEKARRMVLMTVVSTVAGTASELAAMMAGPKAPEMAETKEAVMEMLWAVRMVHQMVHSKE